MIIITYFYQMIASPKTPGGVKSSLFLSKQNHLFPIAISEPNHLFLSFIYSLMDKNKPTAGRTKAIHRRLELSFNLYLLLLFVGQNRASKSLLHITPDFPHLAAFQQIKHLKDNSSSQNPLVIVGFLG